jgi:sulfur transfer protein SufE
MPFIKEDEEKTRNYIFQTDTKTLTTTGFVAIVLVILILAVIASGLYFEWI